MERIVGHGAEHVVDYRKLTGWSTIDPGVLELTDELMDDVMRSGACGVQRMTFVHRNGREVPILAIVAPYFPPDRSRGVFLSALMDITDVPVLQGPEGIVPFDRDVQPPG